jgi:iron complex outermembrane receptor protein
MLDQQKAYGVLGARLSLGASDDRWEVALWGRNITDEKYTVSVAGDDVASWITIPGQPMTYGIEGSYRW